MGLTVSDVPALFFQDLASGRLQFPFLSGYQFTGLFRPLRELN